LGDSFEYFFCDPVCTHCIFNLLVNQLTQWFGRVNHVGLWILNAYEAQYQVLDGGCGGVNSHEVGRMNLVWAQTNSHIDQTGQYI